MTRKIETKADADAIREEWEAFVEDWLPTYAPDGPMEAGGWDSLLDRAETSLDLDLGGSLESAGYKRLKAIAKQVKKEIDAS